MQSLKTRVLFLCTGNSCRSQMAEAWAKTLLVGEVAAYSAGVEKHGINPRAVQVMAEAGVDMSEHKSQLLEEFDLESFDLIVTVCDRARESCPLVPSSCRVIHHSFDDPPGLTRSWEGEEEILSCYRRVRDEIKTYVQELPELIQGKD